MMLLRNLEVVVTTRQKSIFRHVNHWAISERGYISIPSVVSYNSTGYPRSLVVQAAICVIGSLKENQDVVGIIVPRVA